MANDTEDTLDMKIQFSSDSIPIPGAPNTLAKVFLPADTMTRAKEHLKYYGLTELDRFDQATAFEKTLRPQEECLFYVVVVFYQTHDGEWSQERGGNRAELIMKGNNLYYNMQPQINLLPCGQITFPH